MGLSTSEEKIIKRTNKGDGSVTMVTIAEVLDRLQFHYNRSIDVATSLTNGDMLQTDFAYYELTDRNSK